MNFEMDKVNFTQGEVEDVISKYLSIAPEGVHATIELLIKLGVISEYVFQANSIKGEDRK